MFRRHVNQLWRHHVRISNQADARIERDLQEACQPVVETSCKDIQPGDARIERDLQEAC